MSMSMTVTPHIGGEFKWRDCGNGSNGRADTPSGAMAAAERAAFDVWSTMWTEAGGNTGEAE